jgi:hypothetical protein
MAMARSSLISEVFEGENHDSHRIKICVRNRSGRMDQLFSLGHVPGAAINWQGISQDRLPEKNSRFVVRHF